MRDGMPRDDLAFAFDANDVEEGVDKVGGDGGGVGDRRRLRCCCCWTSAGASGRWPRSRASGGEEDDVVEEEGESEVPGGWERRTTRVDLVLRGGSKR